MISLFCGSIIGLLGALARTSRSATVRVPFTVYVAFMRNIPLLLIINFTYFGLPYLGIRFLDNTASVIIALTLSAGAYLTEVFRAGIGSIPIAYIDAGKAIGLTSIQRLRYINMPVMFRIVLPSLSNNFISLFKDTSLAAAIGVPELTYAAVKVNLDYFRVIEAWTTTTAMYVISCYGIGLLLRILERRYAMIR